MTAKPVLYDLSPPIAPDLSVWPGDTPPTRQVLAELARGNTVTLSTLHATVHLGTHADAPSHYGLNAPTIDQQPLDLYLGPCTLLDAPIARGSRVGITDIRGGLDHLSTPRVLIRTGTFPDPCRWNSDFAGLAPELVDALADRGVRLLGVDTPSVDLQESKDLPAHQACLRRNVAILEGLRLGAVPVGVYELIALPLPLVGFDASPIRAILRACPSR